MSTVKEKRKQALGGRHRHRRFLPARRWQRVVLYLLLAIGYIALAVGVIGAFIAETTTPTLGAHPGLGREIMNDVNFQTPRAYAGTAVLILFAVCCFYSLALVERRLAPWRTRSRGDRQ